MFGEFFSEKAIFKDRFDAGRRLGVKLKEQGWPNPYVLGIPRGGVLVGYEVSLSLGCPLYPVTVRKLPIPSDPEAGFGAITATSEVMLNMPLVRRVGLSESEIEAIRAEVQVEVERRQKIYCGGRPFPALSGKTAIIVDDGLASGYTMLAAIETARKHDPQAVVVAVSVSPVRSIRLVKPHCDELICLHSTDTAYFAVASFYEDFRELPDSQVKQLVQERAEAFQENGR